MNPVTFQKLVLRFIALYLRLTILGDFTKEDCADLLEEVENEIQFLPEEDTA